jgi:hypothetical protein
MGRVFNMGIQRSGFVLEIDLQKLADQLPDHRLENLHADIWAGVAVRERARSLSRRLMASQALVLVCALIGSVAAGMHWSAVGPADDLGVFSPHSPWAASTRLDGSAHE